MWMHGPLASSFMLPPKASTLAPGVDNAFDFIFWTSLVFFAIIVGCMVAFVAVYRRTPANPRATSSVTHNTPLELGWSIAPGFLLVLMFWWGFEAFMDMKQIPEDAYQVDVAASQWAWSFKYPNGFETNELHVPAGRPVKLRMNSGDVLHSLYIPDFRVKQDVVPGRYTWTWFQADGVGTHNLFCTEYCGKDHSNMNTIVEVHATEDFPNWLANADPLSKIKDPADIDLYINNFDEFQKKFPDIKKLEPPATTGAALYKRKGCVSCHSLDGSPNTGPSWKGLWGQKAHAVVVDGKEVAVDVDDNYIRESILDPGAKLAKGFGNNMTAYQGRMKDVEIRAIIEYMKTLD